MRKRIRKLVGVLGLLVITATYTFFFQIRRPGLSEEANRALVAAKVEAVKRGWFRFKAHKPDFEDGEWTIIISAIPEPGPFAFVTVRNGKVIKWTGGM